MLKDIIITLINVQKGGQNADFSHKEYGSQYS